MSKMVNLNIEKDGEMLDLEITAKPLTIEYCMRFKTEKVI